MPGPNHAPRGGFQKPKNMGKTVSRLLGYLTRSKLPLLAVLGCLLVSVCTNLGGSYMMRGIINDFIWSGCTDVAGLAQAIVMLVGIYLIGCLATYGQAAIMVRLAQRGVNRLRKDLFDKLQDLPLSYFDQHPHGELMSRFTNDADNVQLALEQSVVSLCSSCLMFVGLVGLMLFINWKLFIVTALLLVVTIQLFKRLGGRSRKFYQQQQAALGDVNGNIQEMIEGLKVVKAFTHEEKAKEEFKKLNETYRDAAQKANYYSTMIMPVSGNLMNISYALTAAFGGLLSVLQGFDLGGLVVYLNYSKQVGQPLNQISQQMTTLLSALAGAERIFEVMDTQPEVDQGSVTLVGAEKDANGTLREYTGSGRPHTWAWKTPRSAGMALVPVLIGPDDNPVELGQAVREQAMMSSVLRLYLGWCWKSRHMVWVQWMAGASLWAVPACHAPNVRSSRVRRWSALTAVYLPPYWLCASRHHRLSAWWRMFSWSHWSSVRALSAQYHRLGVCRSVRLMCMWPPARRFSSGSGMPSTRVVSASMSRIVRGWVWYSSPPSVRLPSGHQPAMSGLEVMWSRSWWPSISISSPTVNVSRLRAGVPM